MASLTGMWTLISNIFATASYAVLVLAYVCPPSNHRRASARFVCLWRHLSANHLSAARLALFHTHVIVDS